MIRIFNGASLLAEIPASDIKEIRPMFSAHIEVTTRYGGKFIATRITSC